MPKERAINPAAAQRKEDKRKAVAKSKKQVQAQRNEKLVKRNPERLQRQIDELKQLESSGSLRPRDKETLAQLEKDLRGIRRAREALGDAAPKFSERRDGGNARDQQRERRAQHIGKRRRDAEDTHHNGSDTDPDVRAIPMPRDTPPPIPRQVFNDPQVGPDGVRVPHALPSKPTPLPTTQLPPAQTVYSSAPQLRDLKKEAVRFMPAAVQAHKNKIKGQGKLLEPEELDRLEKAGYMAAKQAANAGEEEERRLDKIAQVERNPAALQGTDLDKESARFERELAAMQRDLDMAEQSSKQVRMDEVEDDGT
ncbi:hypothetical protein AMS68_006281 [Peltaster fructicola]|uniref:Wbp11/ELF5/Saf1 N-terminal domain-containing protein n=1 Tax=Peltaster fructicola TaxID=286661 RepID=A0A6H0Y185_9PEZI|nr:hypothetical protein AMS68_006281 [Peltaster fructicola]